MTDALVILRIQHRNWEIRMRFSFWLQYLRFECRYAKCECQRFQNVLWFR